VDKQHNKNQWVELGEINDSKRAKRLKTIMTTK
jgi:hypothetical protein